MDSLTFMCFLSIINYSNILRTKIKSVYVKDFLISTKVRLKSVEHLHGEEPISSEPTFSHLLVQFKHSFLDIWKALKSKTCLLKNRSQLAIKILKPYIEKLSGKYSKHKNQIIILEKVSVRNNFLNREFWFFKNLIFNYFSWA